MRVLIVNKHRVDYLGGSEIQCDLLARYLREAGHEVAYGVMAPKGEAYAVEYACEPLHGPLFVSFRRLLRKHRPDVVYWRYNKHHLLACAFLARLHGARLVFAVAHQNDLRPWNWPTTPKRRGTSLARRALGYARGLARSVDGLFNWLGLHFVDVILAQHAGQIPARGRRAVVVPNSMTDDAEPFTWERPYVAWVGNIKRKKNVEAVIRLSGSLADLGVDSLVVGRVQERDYEHFEREPRLSDTCHYLGPRRLEEVNGILRGSLLLTHTCDSEGFPNVFIQAWRQGKPTVSLYYDPDGVIEKRELGLLSGDEQRFANDVRRLLTDAELRREMSARALAYGRRTFDLARNGRNVERILGLLARRGRGADRS